MEKEKKTSKKKQTNYNKKILNSLSQFTILYWVTFPAALGHMQSVGCGLDTSDSSQQPQGLDSHHHTWPVRVRELSVPFQPLHFL